MADSEKTTERGGLRPAQNGTQPRKQTFVERVQNHALTWYHEQDRRKQRDLVLTMWWCCPDCRQHQSPAINSGMEPRYWDEDGSPSERAAEWDERPPHTYLSAFVCRFCDSKWDVTIERVEVPDAR